MIKLELWLVDSSLLPSAITIRLDIITGLEQTQMDTNITNTIQLTKKLLLILLENYWLLRKQGIKVGLLIELELILISCLYILELRIDLQIRKVNIILKTFTLTLKADIVETLTKTMDLDTRFLDW